MCFGKHTSTHENSIFTGGKKMSKLIQVCFLALVVLLGRIPLALSQGSSDEIINNLKVEEIKKIEVRQDGELSYLYIDVTLMNSNDKELLLTKNSFQLSICKTKEYTKCWEGSPDVLTPLGPDIRYRNEDIPLPMQQKQAVQFKIGLGDDRLFVTPKMADIINFVGDSQSAGTIFIEGRFDLGIKARYGWTLVEAIRIAWQLCPEFQDEIPIELSF